MGSKVTLTFAGDSKNLERTFDRVNQRTNEFGRNVERSSDLLDGFGRAGGRAAAGFGLSFSQRIGPLLARAPISPPLVAAVAAAAPAIGAALTSGILLGLGGGVLAAGIISASKDPKVAAAFKGLSDRARKAFAGFGEPFKAPLIRAADTFGDALERMAPAFMRMGKTMAPLIDKLAPAFAQMAEKSLPGIEKAVIASVPLFEKLAEHAPAIGEAISKFFTEIAKGAPSAVKFMEVLLKIAEVALPFLGTQLRLLTGYFGYLYDFWRETFRGIAKAWDWLKNATSSSVRWIGDRFNSLVSFLRGLPKRAGSAFSGMFDGIKSAFRSAVNWVIDRWNNFSIPGISTPFGTMGGFSTPNIPRFHQGGIVPGSPGQEVMAVLQAGEQVIPPGRAASPVVLEIHSGGSRLDDLLVEVLSHAVRRRGGNVQLVLGASRG